MDEDEDESFDEFYAKRKDIVNSVFNLRKIRQSWLVICKPMS